MMMLYHLVFDLLMLSFFIMWFSAESALEAARAALNGGITVVSL